MSLDFIVLSYNRTQSCVTEGQTGHTDEIIYVRFHRYVCISFANFLLCKKYITQLNNTHILDDFLIQFNNYLFVLSYSTLNDCGRVTDNAT